MTRLITLMPTLLLALSVSAQETLVVQEGSMIEIDGTSNKSDWTVKAEVMSGRFQIEDDAVVGGQFTVDASSIKGEHGMIQNRLITQALKAPQNPEIVFELTEITGAEAVEGGTRLLASGTLLLAGVTNEVELEVMMTREDGAVRFSGQHEISMPYYKIKPPTAMFGALHVAKEATVRFDVVAAPETAGTRP